MRKIVLLIVIAILSGIVPAAVAGSGQKPLIRLAYAKALAKAGQYQEARAEFGGLSKKAGNPAEITIQEFAERVLAITGGRSRIVYRPLPVDDPKVRQPDISLARRVLGWEPRVALAAGLEETIAFFAR